MLNASQLVADGLKLVTLPEVYLAVKAVLEDPHSSASDMAEAVESDPALVTRLLRMANSPFFGFSAQIGSVSRAVSMLGTLQIHDLVLASSLATTFQGVDDAVLDVAGFWRDSVRRAVGSKMLAGLCNVLDADRVFLAGLLAHIGEMVLALRAPAELQASIEAAASNNQPLSHALRDQLGFDYGEVGAELIKAWRMPEALEAVVRCHTDPRRATDFLLETAIVHVAAALAGSKAERLDDRAVALLGLDQATLEAVAQDTDQQTAEVLALIQPAARKTA